MGIKGIDMQSKYAIAPQAAHVHYTQTEKHAEKVWLQCFGSSKCEVWRAGSLGAVWIQYGGIIEE